MLDGGKVNSEEFLECKDSVKTYETQIEKVVTKINEAQVAKQEGKTEVVNEKVNEINQNINVAKQSSEEFRKQVTELQAPRPTETTEKEETSQGGGEQEPNNTIFEANSFPVDANATGEISSNDNSDYYKFRNTSNLRDWVEVNLLNQSTTLAPTVTVYDNNKSQMFEKNNWTAGANLEFDFVAEPGKGYYFQIWSRSSTSGKYNLSVKSQKAYDKYEPNDDALSATPLKTGQTITANIIDGNDGDWYKVTGSTGERIAVLLENQSTTLAPTVTVYDKNKSNLIEKNDWTPGANLEFDFDTRPGKEYYIQIWSRSSTSGKYNLIVN